MYLTVYRGTTTGWFGYIACEGSKAVFQSGRGSFSPNPPVEIEGENFRLESGYDPDTTLVPGVTSRRILNPRGRPAADLRFDGDGLYTLRCREGEFLLEDRNGKLLVFSSRNRCVLTMKRLQGAKTPESVRAQFAQLDVEPFFEVTAEPELSLPLVAALASFPLLRFDYDIRRLSF